MKPEIDNDPLVDALRGDLPNDEQSARMRKRLSALGIASAGALATSSAMAAGAAGKGVADVGFAAGALARFTALSFGAKVGVASVVCGSIVAAPVVMLSSPSSPPAQTSAAAKLGQSIPTRGERSLWDSAPALRAPSVEPPSVTSGALEGEAAIPKASPIAEPPTRKGAVKARGGAASAPTAAAVTTPTAAIDGVAAPRVAFEIPEPAPDGTGSATGAAPLTETGSATLPAVPAAPVATTLGEEASLIDRALSALRAGDRELAARLVLEHERRFPNGLLRREREKARAVLTRSNED